MQLKAWYMWASSCNFPNPVSKDLLHCINIVRVVTYQRSRHRLVPSASVCRNMYCNSYYLPFGRKTGIRCRPFHGDNLTWLFYYHWFSTDAECTARRLHDWILISEQLKTTCQERRRERERERERSAVLDVQADEGLSGFTPEAECRQTLKGGVQSVQDICERIPDLDRFQLSPPPVVVSIAWVA